MMQNYSNLQSQINTTRIKVEKIVEYDWDYFNSTVDGLSFLELFNLSEYELCVFSGECSIPVHMDKASILALVLGVTAIALNVSSFFAISQIRSRINTHFRFIASLAASDTLIGVSVIAHVLNNVFNPNFSLGNGPDGARLASRCLFVIIKALNSTGLIVCLLNLTGMAIDHYIAILNPLHHLRLVNSTRGTVIIILCWLVSFLLGFSDFIAEPHKIPQIQENFSVNYCEAVYITRYNEEYCLFVTALITFTIMMFIYTRICVHIRSHIKPGVNLDCHTHATLNAHVTRNKRALITTLLILGTFVICWMPMCLFQITLIFHIKFGNSSVEHLLSVLVKIDNYLYNLLLLNTIADPIIYAVRIKEIRLGYHRLVKKCLRRRRMKRDRSAGSLYRFESGLLDYKLTTMSRSASRSSTFTKVLKF